MKINSHYLELQNNYLFSTVAKKTAAFQAANPSLDVLRLSIGDVTLPLCPSVVRALHNATDEMASAATFRGYGPEQGYGFLREALCKYYKGFGVDLEPTEVFVSDGAKSDLGNVLDILSNENSVLIPDPVYPAYLDVNVMLGRRILTVAGNRENGFKPSPEDAPVADIIYICSPNNPTGAAYNRTELKAWVDFALAHGSLILYDAAYEAFIRDNTLPHSIYEIEGSRNCAIELCSFSKTAGFTGTRCGYTVVPHTLVFDGTELNHLWNRRQCTKFNGVPYIVQRAAEAVFSEQGQSEIHSALSYYFDNATTIHEGLNALGIWHTGGVSSPYIWMECPKGLSSWDFFDILLERGNVVGTPGAGFGKQGEGYFRLTAFGDREKTKEAVKRLTAVIQGL